MPSFYALLSTLKFLCSTCVIPLNSPTGPGHLSGHHRSCRSTPTSPNSIQHHHQRWEGDQHQFLEGEPLLLHLQSQMAQANPAISTMLDNMAKNSTLTVHQVAQVKLPNQGHYLYHWLPSSPSHQQWPTFIDTSTLLLYSRNPDSPNTYSIYTPRHRFSYMFSGTSTPLLPTNSVPITVSSWTPFAVSTLLHHKQISPTVPLAHSVQQTSHTHRASTLNTQTRQHHHPLLIPLQSNPAPPYHPYQQIFPSHFFIQFHPNHISVLSITLLCTS